MSVVVSSDVLQAGLGAAASHGGGGGPTLAVGQVLRGAVLGGLARALGCECVTSVTEAGIVGWSYCKHVLLSIEPVR